MTVQRGKTELHVCITEGVSKTARFLLYKIAKTKLFQTDIELKLYLTDAKQHFDTLESIVKEFQLSGIPWMSNIFYLNIKDAFAIADVLILLHPERGRCGPDPHDYLQPYVELFKEHGLALALFAKPRTRVVVAGDLANTHARVLLEYAKRFPPAHVSAVTRQHANYGRAVLAEKLEVKTPLVRGVLVTGNCTGVQHINAMPAQLATGTRKSREIVRVADELAQDHQWLRKDFEKLTKDASVTSVNVHLPQNALSMATATYQHVYELLRGTYSGRASSAGVYLDYPLGGMKPGIFISLPVQARANRWFIDINAILDMGCLKETIKEAALQLHAEATAALQILAERKYLKENPPCKKSSSLLSVTEVGRWLEELIEKATLSKEDIPSVEELADKYLGSLEEIVDIPSRTSVDKSSEFVKVSSSERKGSGDLMKTGSVSTRDSFESMLQKVLRSMSREDSSFKSSLEEDGKVLVTGKRSGSIVTSKEKYKEGGEFFERKSRPSVTIVEETLTEEPEQKASNELVNGSSKPSVRMTGSKEDNKIRGSSEVVDRKTSLKAKTSGTVFKDGKRASVESVKRKLSVKIVDSKEKPVTTSAEKMVRGSKESVKAASKTSLKRGSSGNVAK